MTITMLLAACLGRESTPTTTLEVDVRRAGPTVEAARTGEVSPTAAAETIPAPSAVPAPAAAPTDRVADEPSGTVTIVLRHGETLDQLARQTGATVEALAALNGIPVRTELRAGTRLTVPATDDLDERRDAAMDLRLTYFLEAHGGLVGVATRDVKTGDTAWAIARQEDVPAWVLAAFNRDADLGRIAAGDTLFLPVIGDSALAVADAEADSGVE